MQAMGTDQYKKDLPSTARVATKWKINRKESAGSALAPAHSSLIHVNNVSLSAVTRAPSSVSVTNVPAISPELASGTISDVSPNILAAAMTDVSLTNILAAAMTDVSLTNILAAAPSSLSN